MVGQAGPSVGGAGNGAVYDEDDVLFNDDKFLGAVANIEAQHLGRLSNVLSNNGTKSCGDEIENSFDKSVSRKRNHHWEGQGSVDLASGQPRGEDDSRKTMRMQDNGTKAPWQDQSVGSRSSKQYEGREPEGEYMAALRGGNSETWLSFGAGRGTQVVSTGMSSKVASRLSDATSRGGACYKCGVEGHWARDCPGGAATSGPSPLVGADMQGKPTVLERLCPCGAGPCLVLTANTEKNMGRSFFKCPLRKDEGQCTFFEWCDAGEQSMTTDLGPFQSSNVQPQLQLQCRCGGGPCAVLTAKTEQNMGRQFFKCPLPQGCSFFQWCDEVRNDSGGQNSAAPTRSDYHPGGLSSPAPASGNCFKCGQEGHWSRECPLGQQQSQLGGGFSGQSLPYNSAKAFSHGVSAGSCFKCGGQGHWSTSCPSSEAPQSSPFPGSGGSAAGGNCFKCGSPGHWANKCPNAHR